MVLLIMGMKYVYGDIIQSKLDEINHFHTNEKYLPDITLPEAIIGYSSLEEALAGIETIVLAVPTKAIREVLREN